ncbi:hypothetical protein TYRP_012858 [Tyrophagus putrescentiae]|nr:hypothetical protein TYRP_012858 [Tyrophagus putrescentiae]
MKSPRPSFTPRSSSSSSSVVSAEGGGGGPLRAVSPIIRGSCGHVGDRRGVDQRRKDGLIALLRRLHQNAQRPLGRQHRHQVPDGDDPQHHPGGPVGEELDENERHEGADHDQIALLKEERPAPVNADHAHHAKVPHEEGDAVDVDGDVVGAQHLRQVGEGEEEEHHQRADHQPAVDDLVAAELVEEDEDGGHHDDEAEEDEGVGEGLEDLGGVVHVLVGEGRVDHVDVGGAVEGDGVHGGHHHQHAEGDGDEELDDVLRAVLQLLLLHLLLVAAAAFLHRGRMLLLLVLLSLLTPLGPTKLPLFCGFWLFADLW